VDSWATSQHKITSQNGTATNIRFGNMAGRRKDNEHFVIYLALVPAEVFQFGFSKNNEHL
jgi:hypothetical protein